MVCDGVCGGMLGWLLWYWSKPQKVHLISADSDHRSSDLWPLTSYSAHGDILLWGLLVSHKNWCHGVCCVVCCVKQDNERRISYYWDEINLEREGGREGGRGGTEAAAYSKYIAPDTLTDFSANCLIFDCFNQLFFIFVFVFCFHFHFFYHFRFRFHFFFFSMITFLSILFLSSLYDVPNVYIHVWSDEKSRNKKKQKNKDTMQTEEKDK